MFAKVGKQQMNCSAVPGLDLTHLVFSSANVDCMMEVVGKSIQNCRTHVKRFEP